MGWSPERAVAASGMLSISAASSKLLGRLCFLYYILYYTLPTVYHISCRDLELILAASHLADDWMWEIGRGY